MIEHEYPVRCHAYELVPDSGGAGRFRGALGVARDVEVLTDDVVFSRYGDRQRNAVKGAEGGDIGKPGAFIVNPDNEARRLRSKGVDKLKQGDVVRIITPGGGGFGPPAERDPSFIARDLADGKVSAEHVREAYGQDLLDQALAQLDVAASADE